MPHSTLLITIGTYSKQVGVILAFLVVHKGHRDHKDHPMVREDHRVHKGDVAFQKPLVWPDQILFGLPLHQGLDVQMVLVALNTTCLQRFMRERFWKVHREVIQAIGDPKATLRVIQQLNII